MYIPPHFQEKNQQTIYDTLRKIQTANLVTNHTTGLLATYLPLYLEQTEGEQGVLYGHIAKANPQWQIPLTTTQALALFTGENAYITPSWLPSKQLHHKVVPTWNYQAIHIYGTIEFTENPQTLLSIITKLTQHNEQNLPNPWQVSDAPEDYIQAMLTAIIGIKITITQIEAKNKLSQNKTIQDQQGIIQNLSTSNNTNDQELATTMQKQLSKPPK